MGIGGMGVFSSMTYTHRHRNRGGTGGTEGRCPPTIEKIQVECPFKAYSFANRITKMYLPILSCYMKSEKAITYMSL